MITTYETRRDAGLCVDCGGTGVLDGDVVCRDCAHRRYLEDLAEKHDYERDPIEPREEHCEDR